MKTFNLVVLISGNGSNLQAIIDYIHQHQLKINLCAVISDNPSAYGLTRAKQHGIETQIIDPAELADKSAFNQTLLNQLKSYNPDLIALAGFMRILHPSIIQAFPEKIINIHPSLLPKYRGLNTYQRALDAGDKTHGTTVHIVTEALDDGPILAQEVINIEPDDSVESLRKRTQAIEHRIYPQIIAGLAESRTHK